MRTQFGNLAQRIGSIDSGADDYLLKPYRTEELLAAPVTFMDGRHDDWRDGTPEAHAIRTRALQWRLLLQIDAYQDGELLLNQDGGFFYFWIPADALATHDWTRVRGSLQCH